MFWQRKPAREKNNTALAEMTEQKIKLLSPKESIYKGIQQIQPTQSLTYLLSEKYGGGNRIAIVELNTNFSENRKKYLLYVDIIYAGKPCGGKTLIMSSNDPKDIVDWICKFKGERRDYL